MITLKEKLEILLTDLRDQTDPNSSDAYKWDLILRILELMTGINT